MLPPPPCAAGLPEAEGDGSRVSGGSVEEAQGGVREVSATSDPFFACSGAPSGVLMGNPRPQGEEGAAEDPGQEAAEQHQRGQKPREGQG